MDKRQMRFVMRAARRAKPQHKLSADHVVIRKDAIQRIILEAYELGKEDARKETA